MADSLRDQLLKSGIVKQNRKSKPPRRKKGGAHHHANKADPKAEASGDMDLARAWAMRARVESSERKQAKARAEAEAKARKERLQRLRKTLDGKALNKADAEHVRHFEYGGKIRRVYVDDAQLKALNKGDLVVIQLKGSYVLVTPEVADEVQTFAPQHIALRVNPAADKADDDVPDDLTW